jgi:hypothetical protein
MIGPLFATRHLERQAIPRWQLNHHIKTVCPVADLTVFLKLALISK